MAKHRAPTSKTGALAELAAKLQADCLRKTHATCGDRRDLPTLLVEWTARRAARHTARPGRRMTYCTACGEGWAAFV